MDFNFLRFAYLLFPFSASNVILFIVRCTRNDVGGKGHHATTCAQMVQTKKKLINMYLHREKVIKQMWENVNHCEFG